MSAAATAAGYLYASGRLRGREKRPEGEEQKQGVEKPQKIEQLRAPQVRVAAIPPQEDRRPRRTPVVQYRTRRWKPESQ